MGVMKEKAFVRSSNHLLEIYFGIISSVITKAFIIIKDNRLEVALPLRLFYRAMEGKYAIVVHAQKKK